MKKPIGYPKGQKWSEERMKHFRESGRQEIYTRRMQLLGQNKTPEQIEKMRQAKLGVLKSEEHKANMSKAHKERWARHYELAELHPELSTREIWDLLKSMSE